MGGSCSIFASSADICRLENSGFISFFFRVVSMAPSWTSCFLALLLVWPCMAAVDLRMPPITQPRGNLVNISMYFSDLKTFDEANEKLTVYAIISMNWNDDRWHAASLQKAYDDCALQSCSAEEQEKAVGEAIGNLEGIVFGQTAAAFFEATRVYSQFLGMTVSGTYWTPIPTDLFLKTSDNPLGKTDFDPLIYMLNGTTNIEALWVDRRATTFDVTLSYEHFPFDEQVLDLCVNFDYFTTPKFNAWPVHYEFSEMSERWDMASDLSPIVSAKFMKAMEGKGFFVHAIEIKERVGALIGSKICIEVTVVRRITILLLRFFLPLSFLLFIPFAGFFIPIEMVMPRVATGFISFLSLQVFRTMAYALVPKPSSSLLWMDVAMFSVTVIMFASVLENVLAQAIRANVSSQAARFVDNLSRATFPLTALVILHLLFIMGAARVSAQANMGVCFSLLTLWLLAFCIAVLVYIRCLPQKLMQTLVKRVSRAEFGHNNSGSLDQKELLIVFKVFDDNGTGHITADKVFQKLQAHGLSLPKDHEQHFKENLGSVFHQHGIKETLDLKNFGQHFGELFQFKELAPDLDEDEEIMELPREAVVLPSTDESMRHPCEVIPERE